ncbi:MAG: hypothetical protein VX112_04265 [Pseudomonadota bacterium]|nr:hypothetical protein [Pseudomonadota bacterium]
MIRNQESNNPYTAISFFLLIILSMLSGCSNSNSGEDKLEVRHASKQKNSHLSQFYSRVKQDNQAKSTKNQPSILVQLTEGLLHQGYEYDDVKIHSNIIRIDAESCQSLELNPKDSQQHLEKKHVLDICNSGNIAYIGAMKRYNVKKPSSVKVPLDGKLKHGVNLCGLTIEGKTVLQDTCLMIQLEENSEQKYFTKPIDAQLGLKDPKIAENRYRQEKSAREQYWQERRALQSGQRN